jgi:hypothetical protein
MATRNAGRWLFLGLDVVDISIAVIENIPFSAQDTVWTLETWKMPSLSSVYVSDRGGSARGPFSLYSIVS